MAVLIRVVNGPVGLPVALRANQEHRWHGGTGGTAVPLFDHATSPFASRRDAGLYYALRLLSVAIGFATLVLVARFVGALTTDEPTRVLALLLPATLPQFAFMFSYVTADALLVFCTTASGLALVRVVQSPGDVRRSMVLGALLGLALLVKKTALFMLPGVAVVLGVGCAMRPAQRRAIVRGAVVTAAVVVAVSGWLFVRSFVLYGELLGTEMEARTMPILVWRRPITDPFFWTELPRTLAASFVGVMGWMNLWMPAPVYWLYGGLGVAILVGSVLRARDPWMATSWLFVALCYAGVVVYNMTFPQPQGRYLFAALPFLAYLGGSGLRATIDRIGAPAWTAVGALTVMLVLIDVAAMRTVVRFYDP